MKKTILVLLMFSSALFTNELKAQAKVNVNINVGLQPGWGPDGYYHVEYYYLPDIDAYYFVPKHRFIYFESTRWVFAASLPSKWGSYDLYKGYKIIINEPKPYIHHSFYHVKYAKYRGRFGYQRSIREANKIKAYHHVTPGHGNSRSHAHGHDIHEKKGHK